MMAEYPSLARWFLIGGTALALFGFALWFLLPIRLTFPPFLVTAFLSIVYGTLGMFRRSKEGQTSP